MMSVEQELIKNGYTHKPPYNSARLVIGAVAIGMGFLAHLYVINIYKVKQQCFIERDQGQEQVPHRRARALVTADQRQEGPI